MTRAGSRTKLPSSVKSIDVDFSSLDSLKAALKGQDAVVSTLGAFAAAQQTSLIDAAIAAGVKRFIPSEFGSDTTHPKVSALPVYRDKVAAQQYLKEKPPPAPSATPSSSTAPSSTGASWSAS